MQPLSQSPSYAPSRPRAQSPSRSSAAAPSSSQTFPQTPEALDAVLSRFQEWTSTRKATVDHGFREISYEDAVSANRRAWQPACPGNGSQSEDNRRSKESGVLPIGAPGEIPVRVSADATPADFQPVVEPTSHGRTSTDHSTAEPASNARASNRRKKHAAPEAGTGKRSKAAPAPAARAHSGVASPADAGASAPMDQTIYPQSDFRKLLAEAIFPAAPPRPGNPTTTLTTTMQATGERQVSMSLRMAPNEHALIRSRAASAGISTSAYLRQCALEVEQLREQMRQTLTLLGQSAAIAVSNQTQLQSMGMRAPQPGFLQRLRQVFFGARQAQNLSLRA